MNRADILARFRRRGWTVEERPRSRLRLPDPIAARYPNLPVALVEFLGGLSSCDNASQTAWFLCEADYWGTSGAAFRWDEWERMSLAAWDGDRHGIAKVQAFWDSHFPFMLSVQFGYAYYAVCTTADEFGRVVTGREPEFEYVSPVAESFELFLSFLLSKVDHA